MVELAISTNKVQVQNGDLSIDAYLAMPDKPDKFPGVIVIQEIFGVKFPY